MTEQVQVYPVDASVGGKNAFYHWCNEMEQSRNYGVCAHLLNAFKEGRLKAEVEERGDCAYAMARGRCPAIAMREQELEAGKALYYKPRTNYKEPVQSASLKDTEGYQRGWDRVGISLRSSSQESPLAKPIRTVERVKKETPRPQKRVSAEVGAADYSSLVNEIVSEVAGEQTAKTKSTDKMAEIVKKMKAMRDKNEQ